MKDTGILLGYVVLTVGLFRFYFQSDSFHTIVDDWNEYLEEANFGIPQLYYFPVISVLDFFGSAVCCRTYRRSVAGRKSWFEVLVACTLMQFGGTTLTAIVLGQAPSWVMSKSAFPALVLAWWLTFYCPGDVYWKMIKNNSILLFVIGFFGAISSAHAVGAWGVDKAFYNSFHVNRVAMSKAYFVCVLCGALSASGGGILCEVLGFLRSTKSFVPSKTPALFLIDKYEASATLNKAFWFSVLYYVLIADGYELPFGLQHVSRTTAHSIVAIAHVALYLQATHLPDINVCQEVSNFVMKVFLVEPVVYFDKDDYEKED